MKLPVKIGIIVTMVAVPAAIFFLVIIYGMIRDAIATPIAERQLDTATQTMNSVDRLMNERVHELNVVSQASAVRNLALDPLNKTLQTQADHRLAEVASSTESWLRLNIVTKDGLIVASTKNDLVGQKTEEGTQALQEALTGEPAYSDVFLEGDRPTMLFALPISIGDEAQPISAAVTGYLNWQDVIQLLKEVPRDSVNLYNKEGIEIANKDDLSTILKENRKANPAIADALNGNNGSETVGDQLISFTGEKGYKDFSGNGWVLTIETPTATAFAPATTVAVNVAIILSLSTLGVMVAITFLIGRLVKPITILTDTANRLALGDLTQRVQVKSKNEIGELAVAFNNMADRLQQLYKNLEAKVKQKTAQLAEEVNVVDAERAKDEAILTSIGEGIIAVDSDGRIVKMNNSAFEILGLATQEVFGKPLVESFELFDDQDKPVATENRPSVTTLTTGKRSEDLFTVRRSDGTKAKVSFLSTPIVQQGKVIGGIMILRDVTKEREIDRMKTEFISLASHQLRTPLSAIKWFSEMMVSGDAGDLTPEQQEFVKNIYDSTERMIDLVNSLLNISRIESGRIIVDPKPTDLRELVGGIINDLKAKTEEKEQTLVVSVHKDLPKINLDPHLIGQVYMNFLTNAIKYTPKGGEIAVFISRKGDDVVSQITDNGYGIPVAQQGKVFKKFFRAENIVKVETDGTGLGLYLVKAIIESSGGRVWFKSEEGKGTTFWFSLPMSGMKPKAGEVTLDV